MGCKAVDDARVEGDAGGERIEATGEGMLAGEADGGTAGLGRARATGVHEPAGLAKECGAAAEGVGVPDLHGDRGIRPLRGIRAAIAGEPLGQRLGRERHSVSLLAMVEAAGREKRAASLKHAGIAEGAPSRSSSQSWS